MIIHLNGSIFTPEGVCITGLDIIEGQHIFHGMVHLRKNLPAVCKTIELIVKFCAKIKDRTF